MNYSIFYFLSGANEVTEQLFALGITLTKRGGNYSINDTGVAHGWSLCPFLLLCFQMNED